VTKKCKNLFGLGESANMSRSHRQEGDIWQRRFWEHVIRDEQDFRRHLDYRHWNPVKHGYVRARWIGLIQPSTVLWHKVCNLLIGVAAA
jgi:hypothetical protein